jgi:NADH-quinone oxidoreductase subunit E
MITTDHQVGLAKDETLGKPLRDILDRHQGKRAGGLIALLEEIQGAYGYLPEAALRAVSERTQTPLVDVYGVASFYRAFSLTPRGRHVVCACLGTACHVRGAPMILDEVQRRLGIRAGETTPDREFTLETVNCLGACALGPVITVNGKTHPHVRHDSVRTILRDVREAPDAAAVSKDQRIFPLTVRCSRCNHSLMDAAHPLDGHPSIRVTVTFGRTHGWLRLSSLYGSYTIGMEHEIPMETVGNVFCPHCHAQLIGSAICAECGAPMVPMIVDGGGIIQVCARRGCKGHILDLAGHALA